MTRFHRLTALAIAVCLVTVQVAESETGEQSIVVGPPKLFDVRELENMLRAAEAQLSQLSAFDAQRITAATGNLQGGRYAESAFGLQATTLPTPATTDSSQSVTGTTTGTSLTTVTSATPSVTTSDTATASEQLTDTSQTTVASVAPAISAPPTPSSAFATAATFGLSGRDLLAEQMSLTHQIVNLRLLLKSSLSDRMELGGTDWLKVAKEIEDRKEPSTLRAPTLLGFQIWLDPARAHRKAVAEITVEVRTKGGGHLLLMSQIPEKDTYNVATIRKKAKSIGLGAIANVVNLGVAGSGKQETFYIVKDTDTVSFQHSDGRSESITFGWQFRPVLGRHVVNPGMRQVFVELSLPDWTLTELEIEVSSRWRRFRTNQRASTVGKAIGDPRTHHRSALQVPGSGELDHHFKPLPNRTPRWKHLGGGTVQVTVEGRFPPGTRVRLGDRILASQDAFVFAEHRLQFVAKAAELLTLPADLVGPYGVQRPLALKPPSGLPLTLSVGAAAVTKVDTLRSTGRLELSEVKGLPANCHPLIEVGGVILGLERPLVPGGQCCPDGQSIFADVPTSALLVDHEVALIELFWGPTASLRATADLDHRDLFKSDGKIVTLFKGKNESGKKFARWHITGRSFKPETIKVEIGKQTVKGGEGWTATSLTLDVLDDWLEGVGYVVVRQNSVTELIALKAPKKASAKPTLELVSRIAQGDSKDVTIRGTHLDSIAELKYEGWTLSFKLADDKKSMQVRLTEAITEKPGQKQLSVVLRDETSQPFVVTVSARPD